MALRFDVCLDDHVRDTPISKYLELHKQELHIHSLDPQYQQSLDEKYRHFLVEQLPDSLLGSYAGRPPPVGIERKGVFGHEVFWFLKEAFFNARKHSEFRYPAGVMLWKGRDEYIVGVCQKGFGFDARRAESERPCTQGFAGYTRCCADVFFDDPRNARAVFARFYDPSRR